MVTAVLARVRAFDRRAQERATFGLGALVVVGFVLARWLVAARDQLSRFVVAGSDWSSRAHTPGFLYVFPHAEGYDGQFYWRLAVDPAQLHLRPYMGVRIDNAYRLNRIFFPALVWVVSLGRAHLVALAMVVVNIVAILALLALGLRLVRRQSMSPAWALLLLCVPGLVGSLSRDLTETLTCCLGLGAMVAIREGRTVIAAVCFSAAVLTRETMLVAVIVYGVAAVVAILRRQRRLSLSDLAWVVPLIVFALWQFVVKLDIGTVPILSSAGSGDIGAPFVGFFQSVGPWFSSGTWHQVAKGLFYTAQTISVVVLLWLAWCNRHRARTVEVVTMVGFVMLLVLETKQGWIAPFDARYASFPMVGAWSQLVEGGDRVLVRRAAWVVIPVVALTVVWRVAVI
jgi:hypothetical protein